MNLNLKHSGDLHRKAGKKMNSKDPGGLVPYKYSPRPSCM